MGDCVDEAIVLLVAADFAHQETRIEDQAENDRREENDAEDKKNVFAPVEDDPADVQREGESDQANAQNDKESDLLPAAGDSHGCLSQIVQRTRGCMVLNCLTHSEGIGSQQGTD